MNEGTTFELPTGQRQLFLDDVGIACIEKLNRMNDLPERNKFWNKIQIQVLLP